METSGTRDGVDVGRYEREPVRHFSAITADKAKNILQDLGRKALEAFSVAPWVQCTQQLRAQPLN